MTDQTNAVDVEEPLLAGVRVLDFGRYIAGPYCAALLADLGAEVIRIEKLAGSEDRYVCPVTHNGEGTLFLQLNRNKKCITLNPLKPEGREVVKRLIASADIVVANMPIDGQREMGIDYESLKAIKADIILSSQTAFGDSGPYAKRPGFDGVAQAMSGATYMSGNPGSPFKSYASWCDFSTGMVAAYGTVAALLYKWKTGKGQEVKANLLRTAMNIFHFNTIEAYMHGRERKPSGNRSQFGGPADLFKTKDGWVQMQIVGQGLFERWCDMVNAPDLKADPRLQTDSGRADEGELLAQRGQQWISQFTTDEALQTLEAARIPAGPLYSPLQTLEDPQVKATGLLHYIDYPGLPKPAPLVPGPIEFTAFDAVIKMPPPTLGQHTDEILKGIGYSAENIAELRAKRVV
jgi:crotonobetainyl-CoA:carnitine CoA-transferase CaiB-like acyl-CoA transferase